MNLPDYVENHADIILLARQKFYEHNDEPPVYIYFSAKNIFPFSQMNGGCRMLELSNTLFGMVPVLDDRLTPDQFIITKEPLHG